MKFKPVFLPLSDAELEDDWTRARNIGKVRLGERCLFLTKFSGTHYLPYSRITRVWLRQEEVSAKMCCGRANFDQFYLMVQTGDGQTFKAQVLDKEPGKAALAHISARNPEVQVGPPAKE